MTESFDDFKPTQPAAESFDDFEPTQPPVRAVLQSAVKQNPDQVARAATLGKQYGIPTDVVVRNLQNVEFQAAVDAADARLQTSPKLAAAMRKRPEIAPLVHDDLEPLAKIESNFAQVAAASVGQAVLGISEGIWRTPDAAQRAVGYLAGQVERTGLPRQLNPIRGVQDVIRFISEGRVPAVGSMGGTTQIADKVNDAQKILTDTETFGSAFADVQTLAQNADKALAAAITTGNVGQVSQVLTDPNYWAAFMSQAIPSLYLAMKSGGSVGFMGWLEGMEQAGNAAEFEKKTGQKISDADFTQAVAQTAIVNALLEKYGLDRVLGAKGNGLKGLAKAMIAEGGTEGLQQVNSNLAALLSYNEGQGLTEGVLASIMGGVGAGGGVSAAQQAAGQVQALVEKRTQQADAANQYSDNLAEALKTAGAAALRERSPEQFRELMGEMTDGKVYVDGEVLNQLPPDVIATLPQSVQDQIATAAATGDVVEIAVADVLTVAPGTALEQTLVEHARTDPFAMSQAEATKAGEQAQTYLQQEAERVIAEAQDRDAMQASSDLVKQTIFDELTAAGRYRPAVNEGMATWAAAFYTAYGSRLGITPEEMFSRYRLRVLGEASSAGQTVMDQGPQYPLAPPGERYEETDVQPTMMSPDQFLSRVRPLEIDDASRDNIDDLKAHILAGRKLDPLHIRADGKEDGRHRAIAARELGIRQVPVVDEQPTASKASQTETPEFQAWFGDSKVVDAEGKPLVVYHGTNADFAEFKVGNGMLGQGIYFTPNAKSASVYPTLQNMRAQREGNEAGAISVMPVYVSLRNPLVLTELPAGKVDAKRVASQGYDGIVLLNPDGTTKELTAFRPTQIKSAIGNSGAFDPANPSILEQSAFHGTPHRGIEKFSTDKIGTGEGFQAFGWGLYFTDRREIAEWYREKLTKEDATQAPRRFFKGQEFQPGTGGYFAARLVSGGTLAAARKDVASWIKDADGWSEQRKADKGEQETLRVWREALEVLAQADSKKDFTEKAAQGQLYKVELPEDSDMLLWDKPLSQQPEKVRKALKDSGLAKELKDNLSDYSSPRDTRGKLMGENIYAYLQWKLGSPRAASERLRELGILGANYPAGTIAGNKNSRARNYVVFSGDDVAITDQFYQNAPQPRGTFNPKTLELVLNPNANLSTFFHETGHFFLEVMADIASQPNAPAQIAEDMGTFLKWAGITGDENAGGPDAGGALNQEDSEAQAAVVYQEIANDQEMIDALEVYMVSGDPPEGALNDKLVEYINRLPPVPADSYLTFYRNQPRGASPWRRGWSSWTINEDQTRYFGGRDFEVLKRKGVHGLDLNRLGEYRTRVTGEYSQYGSQGEWLVLNESVFNQNGPATQAPPVQPRRTPLETWQAMTLDQKRQYHERWAESVEQYVMEGRAPSVELQPLMRRFATWLKSVYGSIKQFLAARGQAVSGGAALNQGDDSAFKRWFGDSKVVDKSGKPLVVYHGTEKSGFDVFDPERAGANTGRNFDGVYFTNAKAGAETYSGTRREANPSSTFDPEYDAEPGNYPVYLKLEDPYVVDFGDQGWDAEVDGFFGMDEIVAYAKGAGHDGVIAENVNDEGRHGQGYGWGDKTYVVFNSEQIKSATKNDGSFDANDPSILSQDPAAQPGPPMALNDDIRRVMDRMLATDEQIAQANEVAGLLPDEAADAQAAERLNKRSMADLKWAVRARDQVVAKLRKQAAAIEKDIRQQVTVEVDQTPEMRAKRALDALSVTPEYAATLAEHKAARKAAEAATRDEVKAALLAENPDVKGLVKGQLLMKNKRDIDNKVESAMIKWDQANPAPKRPVNATDADVATIADSFGFETVDGMLQAIDAFGSRADAIDGLTERRMLEEHGDLIDERAITEAANEAVHNEARARSLATELRTQSEMLNPRADTGETTAKGSKITVNALVEAAKQFAANVVARTTLRDLTARAWQHTAAERRAAKRWQEATAAGKTAEAVKAKQDQMLNHAAAKASIDAKAEAKKILDFFRRVTQGNDEKVVDKGRDPDIVNAARAVLGAYGVQTSATKRADEYLAAVQKNDPETFNVIAPMIEGATRNAQPLDALTFEELQGLNEEIQALWFLAKRSRQMEVGGDLLDVEDVADEVYDRLEEIGIPDTIPGETGALTDREIQARRWLQQVPALLRRVEQWAEAKDGKFGGPFLRYIFQPVKDAADRYRADKIAYRKKFGDLVDAIAPMMPAGLIQAPEIGYVFGRGHNGVGMSELLHAIAHTGNESNKRKLLLGRGWATENADGTLDTAKWDALIQRLVSERKLLPPHYDFVQGVWDLLEQTKPLAQKTHREVFGRYFAEVTADPFVDPFGVQRAGGYIPAQADPLLVQDADLRELLETDNAGMSQAFPATNKGFTKSRVEYNRPLKLDLRTLPQHIDKVLLFSHMEPAVRGVARLLRQPKVAQPLARVDPAAVGGMLKPWLNRSARQAVETPVSADAGLNRVMSTIRSRVGMALMFANVSNTLQQITGFSSAALKVKPALMTRAAAQFIASPKRFKESVWALSPYMADRASNEVAVMSDTMEKILIKPSVYARAEMWTREHAYFLQTAFDNVMSPIIWTGAYNQGVAEGMDERMAIRYADGVIRQTQGSTLPEDISRIESGPAYARVFTQFIGYFNMLANTNGTALKQIADEQGLKKGAGKAFGVVMLGLLVPIWVAEAIAHAMRGGPEDDEDDGYLDDWLAAVFGFGTLRGFFGGMPFIGAAAQSAVNRFNDQPADDKFSLSPTVSVLEAAVGAPASVYGAIVDDKNAQKAVRDLSALITVATGLPAMTLARPVGYAAGVAQGRIEPTGPVDAARGLVTGTASPESKQR